MEIWTRPSGSPGEQCEPQLSMKRSTLPCVPRVWSRANGNNNTSSNRMTNVLLSDQAFFSEKYLIGTYP